jgi:pimeloyl-ACP methyl ester carboxylesterase
MSDGALVYVRRHGNPDGPRMVLSHGCGLSIDTYYPYWSLLQDRFDLFVYDLRSHGWNPPGNIRAQNIPTFVQDCESVLRAIGRDYDEKPVVGAFHSLSGLVALLHEEQWKGFAGLMLFDVPILPPGGRPEDLVEMGEDMSATARRRRYRFESKEDFAQRITRSPVYRNLPSPIVDLMADTTLRHSPDRTAYELCCPREYEAQVYEYLFGWAMRVNLQRVSCPVKVVGADPTAPFTFMPSMDLSELVDLDYDYLPDSTHFLQLEEPEKCVDFTVDFMESRELI